MMEVETLGTETERVEERYEGQRARQTWARSIWGPVARLNVCLYYCQTPSPQRYSERLSGGKARWVDPHKGDLHTVIPRRANVMSTQLIAQYRIETVERLARECPHISGAQDHHAFKLGCARRLSERLGRLRESRFHAETAVPPSSQSSGPPTFAGSYQTHDIANRSMFQEIHGYRLGVPADNVQLRRLLPRREGRRGHRPRHALHKSGPALLGGS
jgi:hypothetical protein